MDAGRVSAVRWWSRARQGADVDLHDTQSTGGAVCSHFMCGICDVWYTSTCAIGPRICSIECRQIQDTIDDRQSDYWSSLEQDDQYYIEDNEE